MTLKNLDRSLRIDSLDGIQLIPGPGPESINQWVHACSKVLSVGKYLQVFCKPHEVEILLSKLKHDRLFLCVTCKTEKEAHNLLKMVERYI